MVEDLLSLPDQELRAELEADGASVEELAARFDSVAERAGREAARRVRLREEERVGPLPLSPGRRLAFAARAARPAEPFGREETGLGSPLGNRRPRRGVTMRRGRVDEVLDLLPEFEVRPFTLEPGMEEHPLRRAVVRRPTPGWSPLAMGTVSRTYYLLQHREAAERCLAQLDRVGIRREELEIELRHSLLGDWVHLAFILADSAFVDRHGHEAQFRCECVNTVAGPGPVALWFGWLRPVCGNGMILRESRCETAPHRAGPTMAGLWSRVFRGYAGPAEEGRILSAWESQPVSLPVVAEWLEESVRQRLLSRGGAARVHGICQTGMDRRTRVPGSPPEAGTVFDVVQAVSWVFSHGSDARNQYRQLRRMPRLARSLAAAA